MIQSIISAKPDVIGFQEPRQEQVDDLTDGLTPLWSCTSQLIWNGGDVSFSVTIFSVSGAVRV